MPFFLLYFLTFGVFFLVRAVNAQVRLSDTNIYFYSAYQLLQGKMLYKDIFFTNLPIFPYISTLYFTLLGGDLVGYYLTPTLEVAGTTLLIFFILKHQTKNAVFSFFSSLLYCFSFIVLVTSTHQTGVFLTAFLGTLSYLLFVHKRYALSGIALAIAVCTKAYIAPVVAAYFIYLFVKDKKALLITLTSFSITVLAVVLPFLIYARAEFVAQVINYSLTRGGGTNKLNVLWFTATHDLLLFALFISLFIRPKRQFFFFLIGVCTALFFILYQDIYYLYLNVFVPFIILSLSNVYIDHKGLIEKYRVPLYAAVTVLSLVNLLWFSTAFSSVQAMYSFDKVAERVKKEAPAVIYGTNDIAPALSYTTAIPLLDGVIDTNDNIFRKKILSAKDMTMKAVSQKALLVGHGLYIPERQVDIALGDEIFDLQLVKKHCRLLERYPTIDERGSNSLSLFACY